MPRKILALALAFAAMTAACGRGDNRTADTALNTDLSLAAQQKGYQPLDSLSAAERATAGTASTRTAGGDVAPRRRTTSSGTTRQATTTTQSSGGTVVKHTNRDAAIGAAAGAIIGATTSRNKVKGGVIGAVAGGILGGVIGNNVDKQKKKVP